MIAAMPTPVAQRTNTALPALPPLNISQLRLDSVSTQCGELEAFVPVDRPYVNDDPLAPALLLIPGLGVDGLGFIRQLPLGATGPLHLFQMPNGPVAGEGNLESFARCVEEYILAKKLDQRPGGMVLGGTSMGGTISMLVALRGRVKLRGLVLVATYGSCRHISVLGRVFAPLAYIVPMRLLRRWRWKLAHIFGNRTREECEWMANPKIYRTRGYYHRAVAGLTCFEVVEKLKLLKVPTLILHGTRDQVIPFAAAEELASAIPNAQLTRIDGARHSLFFTRAEEVNAAIAKFLAQL